MTYRNQWNDHERDGPLQRAQQRFRRQMIKLSWTYKQELMRSHRWDPNDQGPPGTVETQVVPVIIEDQHARDRLVGGDNLCDCPYWQHEISNPTVTLPDESN